MLLRPQSWTSLVFRLCGRTKARYTRREQLRKITSAHLKASSSTAAMGDSSSESNPMKYADVGVNLTDSAFRGLYHGKQAHKGDLDAVIVRATRHGAAKLMITGSDLEESRKAVDLALEHPNLCYATVGVHPCSSKTFETHPTGTDGLIRSLHELITNANSPSPLAPPVTALGEMGLDYDRLNLSSKETQIDAFNAQLYLAIRLDPSLPLFLHSRAAHSDFVTCLLPRLPNLPKRGLVHSFTGTLKEMWELVDLGFHVGVNGCSVKTEENLAVVRELPLDRLQLETDAPWCEMRPSHAGFKLLVSETEGGKEEVLAPFPKQVKKERWDEGLMVKGRNEPCMIELVAEVVACVKGISLEEVCEAAWKNSVTMFGFGERGH